MKSHSTADSVFTLFSFFEILKSKKKFFLGAFLDFEKVFGKVWTEALRVVQTSIK